MTFFSNSEAGWKERRMWMEGEKKCGWKERRMKRRNVKVCEPKTKLTRYRRAIEIRRDPERNLKYQLRARLKERLEEGQNCRIPFLVHQIHNSIDQLEVLFV